MPEVINNKDSDLDGFLKSQSLTMYLDRGQTMVYGFDDGERFDMPLRLALAIASCEERQLPKSGDLESES